MAEGGFGSNQDCLQAGKGQVNDECSLLFFSLISIGKASVVDLDLETNAQISIHVTVG